MVTRRRPDSKLKLLVLHNRAGRGAGSSDPAPEAVPADHAALDHLRSLAELVGADYRRLNAPGVLMAAMLDRRFAQSQAADTDLRWIAALLALLLLAWRFAPDLRWRWPGRWPLRARTIERTAREFTRRA